MNDQERQSRPLLIGLMAAAVLPLGGLTWLIFGPGYGDLGGRVTCGGKPVTVGAVVVLAADGTVRSAPLSADGSYRLTGVPRGPARLGVVSRDPAKAQLRHTQMLRPSDRLTGDDRFNVPAPSGQWIPVPEKFSDPKSSGLETVVKRSAAYDIELR
jgi:hypothetical protein